MSGKIDIYCEFGFLEKFYSTWPQINDKNALKNLRYWYDLDELLRKHCSVVIIDIDSKTLVEKYENCEDPILREALLMILDTGLACCPTEKKNMEIHIEDNEGAIYFGDEPQRIFLLDADLEKCQQLENDYGLMFISNDNFASRANFLFSSDIALVNEKTNKDWSFVEQYKHPCNYIILIDNHIYNNKKDSSILTKNIKSLFNALLPAQLNQKIFDVQIFATDANDGKDNYKKGLIENTIRSLRTYEIVVTFSTSHKTIGNQHDRCLLTNYCMFNSGYGFVLGQSERVKGTSLMVWPLTYLSNYGNKESRNNTYQIMQFLRKKN